MYSLPTSCIPVFYMKAQKKPARLETYGQTSLCLVKLSRAPKIA